MRFQGRCQETLSTDFDFDGLSTFPEPCIVKGLSLTLGYPSVQNRPLGFLLGLLGLHHGLWLLQLLQEALNALPDSLPHLLVVVLLLGSFESIGVVTLFASGFPGLRYFAVLGLSAT